MSTIEERALADAGAPCWPARRFLHWCVQAWLMLRRAPVRFALLCLVPMLAEVVIQLSIPVAGVVASKLLVPLFSATCLLLTDQKARQGSFGTGQALRRLAAVRGRLAWVAVASALVFAWQVLVAWAIAGPAAAQALVVFDPATAGRLGRGTVAVVLASGMLPAALLVTTIPRIVLDGVAPIEALRGNLQWAGRAWRPLAVYLLACAALVAGVVHAAWLLLVLLPFGYVGYWLYRDASDPATSA
jgi:hypothetical protein